MTTPEQPQRPAGAEGAPEDQDASEAQPEGGPAHARWIGTAEGATNPEAPPGSPPEPAPAPATTPEPPAGAAVASGQPAGATSPEQGTTASEEPAQAGERPFAAALPDPLTSPSEDNPPELSAPD